MLFKTLSFKLSEKADLAKGEFAGYASTWMNVDSYGDIIQKGAFARSLPKFLESGLILWQHNTRVPIGKPIEAREDDQGLWIRAKVSDTRDGQDALTLMRDGVIQKMSIGYDTEGYRILSEAEGRELLGSAAYDEAIKNLPWWSDQKLRLLTDIDLWEVSPVSFPANERATITSVKSPDGRMPETEREFERFLRDAGLPKAVAVAVTSHGFKGVADLRDAGRKDPERTNPETRDQRDADRPSAGDLLLMEHIRSRAQRRDSGVLVVG